MGSPPLALSPKHLGHLPLHPTIGELGHRQPRGNSQTCIPMSLCPCLKRRFNPLNHTAGPVSCFQTAVIGQELSKSPLGNEGLSSLEASTQAFPVVSRSEQPTNQPLRSFKFLQGFPEMVDSSRGQTPQKHVTQRIGGWKELPSRASSLVALDRGHRDSGFERRLGCGAAGEGLEDVLTQKMDL